jgi:DNA-binding transcriptional regulator YiaG
MAKLKYTSQTKLATKLGVTLQSVQMWIQRGRVKFKTDETTGVRLVEDIDSIPTVDYSAKKNKK